MSQPVETTSDLTFTMSESSKDTENAADKTEGSIAKSFQDAQQPKANVRGSMIEDHLRTTPRNVPIHTEPLVSVKKGMLCEKLQSLLVHGTLSSSGLTLSKTEIGVCKGFTAREPSFQNFELYIDQRFDNPEGRKGRMGSKDDFRQSTEISRDC